jgi:hypothetical protein
MTIIGKRRLAGGEKQDNNRAEMMRELIWRG